MDWDEIVTVVRARQINQGPLLARMIDVRDRYNADYVVPWVSDDETEAPALAMPLLITEAIDGNAMRAASVMPHINTPALKAGKERGKHSREFASLRARAYADVWRRSRLSLGLRRSFRHLAGYATTALVVTPDFEKRRPTIEVRDPLTAYPAARAAEDLSPPSDCAFVYAKSSQWVRHNFPAARAIVPEPSRAGVNDLWEIVEWIDADHIVMGIMGPTEFGDRYDSWQSSTSTITGGSMMELGRWRNLAGRCTAVVPRRVTMDRIASSVAHVVGTYDLMAKLTYLHLQATEKAIYPDRYVMGGENMTPSLVDGEWHDGRSGMVNLLRGAREVGDLRGTPDPTNLQMMDRLERSVRAGGGLNPAMMGETAGALRTGRGIDSMMAAAVDPRIQEMQEIMECALEEVNELVHDSFLGYWPQRKYQMFAGRRADGEQFEFQPEKHLETEANSVSYAIAGADVQGATIILGQMEGSGMISRHQARARHPWIDDPEGERRRIDEEGLERAAAEALMQQAVSGAVPITYLIKVEKHIKNGLDMLQAIDAADKEIRAEQATPPPPPDEGQAAPPGAMPGIAPPGAVPPGLPAGELPPAAVPGNRVPEEGQLQIRQLMNAMSQEPVEVS